MSLAQVAGGQVSRTTVHLVEHDAVRPSMPVLELIAERTGHPIEFFLADETRAARDAQDLVDREVARLEELSERFEHQSVVELAGSLLEGKTAQAREADIRFRLGAALIGLWKPEPALENLALAMKAYEASRDGWMIAECLDAQGSALYLQQDPSARQVTERALAECQALEPIPTRTLAKILGHLATIYVADHEWEKALATYEAAVAAAGTVQDLARVVRMYAGMSLAYEGLGRSSRALSYSYKAIALQAALGDQALLANAENNLGYLLLKHGDGAEAGRHLHRALQLFEQAGLEQKKSHVLMSLAELSIDQGDAEEGERQARAALELSERLGERANTAASHELLGKAAETRSDTGAADGHFHAAIDLFQQIGLTERLIECHSKYAELLELRQDPEAGRHWKAALALSRPHLIAKGGAQADEGRRAV